MPQILLHKVIIAKDVEDAEKALLNLSGLRRYLGHLRTEAEKKDFRNHLRKYINMYLPDCPFEVSTTNRYTITAHEAAVTARKRIREGDKIKYLCGTLVPLTEAELTDLDLTQRNFSIVQSDRKKNTLIFLGPARFANHDCAANGRLVSVGKDGLEVHATRNIDIGEEITVTYSLGYFGTNNEECLCHTCELNARNGWTSADAFGAPQSGESTPIPGEVFDSPYSFRKKRKHGADTSNSSVGQSPSPPKKRKLGRPPSRLNQVLTPPPSSRPFEEDSVPTSDHEPGDLSASKAFTDNHQSECKSSGLEREMVESVFPNELGTTAITDPPRKRRMRLIDQMTSSAGSSPEVPTQKRPSSSISDESNNDSAVSKDSSGSTQATSISEDPVAIKVESAEVSKIERDEPSTQTSNPISSTKKPPDCAGPATAQTTLKTTEITLMAKPAAPSSILPSIESPMPATPVEAITETRTTLTVLPDPTAPLTIRTPGDYILTRRLIAQPFDRWVQCQTCSEFFVQCNGYQTRRECPRCERHSMLYGFTWPKTEPNARRLRELKEKEEKSKGKGRKGRYGDTIVVESENESVTAGPTRQQRCKGGGVWGRGGKGGGRSGKSGKGTWVEGGGEDEREERVMDHRTVNRFIAPEEEREVRRRGKNSLLELASGVSGGIGTGMRKSSMTPDQLLLPRIRGAQFWERSGSAASVTEESVGSCGGGLFEEGDVGAAALRRSKRYFGSRMTM